MLHKSFFHICLVLMLFFATLHNTNNAWSAFEFNHSCIPAPDFTEFDKTSKNIDVGDDLGKWQSSGKSVSNGDSIKFAWNADNVYIPPKKYMILYRIDPRFQRPQVFIKSWNYATGNWDSDFDSFIGKCGAGSLPYYQSKTPPTLNGSAAVIPQSLCPDGVTYYTVQDQINDFVNYFNFVGRSKININSGDVINIKSESASSFFSAGPNFTTDYKLNSFSGKKPIHYIYTDVGFADGRGIYSLAQDWMQYLTDKGVDSSYSLNYDTQTPPVAWFHSNNVNTAFGIADSTASALLNGTEPKCNQDGFLTPFCDHFNTRGMKITIDGNIIKDPSQIFNNNQDFFYTIAQNSGDLDFSSSWRIGAPLNTNIPMFRNLDIHMQNWAPANPITGWTYNDLYQIQQNIITSGLSYIEMYREVMSVEIGGNAAAVQNDIGVEYMISHTKPPDSASGTTVAANDTIYAGSNGSLWIRAVNNDPSYSVSGNLNLYMATYNGPTFISDFVYNDIVKPILTKLNDLTFTLYQGLISNVTFRNIAVSLLTIYIMLYGIYYLAGATNITSYDLVARIVKISIITTLFSPGSWAFFNDHFFSAFINGTSYLIYNIIGTNTHQNIFGFLDVIFNKFINPDLWGNLLIQFVNFQTGLSFFALLVIIGLLRYLLTLLEVVVAYLMAFVTIAVLISLAPFFITFMLFSRTKNLFNNWIGALFNAAIYPTILLVFYLLLDDIVTVLLENAVVESCWGTLLPIKFSLSLKDIGLDWSTTFSIPGFPGIGFWLPASDVGGIVGQAGSYSTIITSSIIFFCYANAASNLLGFVTGIVGSLARVGDSAGGVVPQKSMTSILHDVTIGKRMAGNLGARAAFGIYDHGPGVARSAIKVGSYGLNASASAAYHAPKNIVKGLGYAAGKTFVAAKATGSAIKATPGKISSGASQALETGREGIKMTSAAVSRAKNATTNAAIKAKSAVVSSGKKALEATGNTMAGAKKLVQDTKFALSKEGRKARSIAKKTKAANLATQKYRDHAKKLEENKAKALEKAQAKVAKDKATAEAQMASKIERKKKWNELKDSTIGAAGRGLDATGEAIKGTFGKEARDGRKAAREEAKTIADQKKANLATQKYRDHAKKLEENKAKALEKAQAKVAKDKATAEAQMASKIERKKKWNELKDSTIGAAGRGLDATGETIKSTFGKEARDGRKAARQKFKGDLGDKIIYGVKDVGNNALKTLTKGGNKLSGARDAIKDAPSEIGHAASLAGRGIADITHIALEKGRDLKNKAAHSGVVIKTAGEEGYDKGKGVPTAEFAQKQQAREDRIEKVKTYRSDAKTAKQQERSDLLEQRKKKDEAISNKRDTRAEKAEARIDKIKDQVEQREQDRSKKKDIRDLAIDRKVKRDREDKERAKNNKDKSPAEKLREYKEVSERRRKEDIADARNLAMKYSKNKK